MRAFRVVLVVLLAALSVGGLIAYRWGWHPQLSGRAPVVEYRVSQSDARGQTERLLTIDHAGQAILQEVPSGPGGTTTQLTCEELQVAHSFAGG
jgi:hypothetical protein